MQHHIITVGTSLASNASKTLDKTPNAILSDTPAISRLLTERPLESCAEINSLHARTQFLDKPDALKAITLIYSETQLGKGCASHLETFFKHRNIEVHKIPIRGFDKPAADVTPDFAQAEVNEALQSLKLSLIRHIEKLRKEDPDLPIEFNITGGYKAEAAFIYPIAAQLNCPCYYLHETFKTAVTLPLTPRPSAIRQS